MDKSSLLLAAMYPAGLASHNPVHIQKLIFLIQQKIPAFQSDGFNFQAYDYGPFDKNVYVQLEALKDQGLVEISEKSGQSWSTYSLTTQGKDKAELIFNQMDIEQKSIVESLSSFVRKLSFSQLVSAVYKAFPDMKENSVFKD